MATIVQTTGVKGSNSNGAVNLTRTALTASDTLTFQNGGGQTLSLYNTTASPVVVTLTGSAPSPIVPAGYGGSISTSAGKAVTVPASGWTSLELDDIWPYLDGSGAVTVTGGTGLVAALFI